MRVALVTNPASGKNKRDPALRGRLLAALPPGALDLAPDGPTGWGAVAARLLDEGVDRVALSGGDGTLHCLLSALAAAAPAERWPAVALLRTGTMNTLAANLGVRGRPEQIAAQIAALEPTLVPVLRVGTGVGFLFGVGVHVAFLQEYDRGRTGPLGAAILLARVAVGVVLRTRLARGMLRPTDADVALDGAPWAGRSWYGLGAGTLPSVGLGFRPAPRTPAAGRFEAYGFPSAPAILRNLLRIRLARPLAGAGVVQALGGELTVRAEGAIPYMIDGDLYEARDALTLLAGPAVRLLR